MAIKVDDLLLTQAQFTSFCDSGGYLDTQGEIGVLEAQRDKVLEAVLKWWKGEADAMQDIEGSAFENPMRGVLRHQIKRFKKDFGLGDP